MVIGAMDAMADSQTLEQVCEEGVKGRDKTRKSLYARVCEKRGFAQNDKRRRAYKMTSRCEV